MSALIRCSTCKRHHYESETACPFCARAAIATPGTIAVALTAAASIALAGCANDAPKNDPSTDVAPEARKTEASQTVAKPEPPPTPAPIASAPEPAPAPSASVATTPTTPPPATTPTTTPINPRVTAAPAYGLPPPTTTTIKRPPPAAYGGPPPKKGPLGDPLF